MRAFASLAAGLLLVFGSCSLLADELEKKPAGGPFGERTLRVNVVDMEGTPLEGISISMEGIQPRPKANPDILIEAVSSLLDRIIQDEEPPVAKSDRQGVAVLTWQPSAATEWIKITAETGDQYYIYNDNSFSREELPLPKELTLRLCPFETISGRVTRADGTPAEGIQVVAHGRGVTPSVGRGRATTDTNGEYEIKVKAEQAYFVRIEESQWVSPRAWPLILHVGEPLEDIDLSLIRPTRIHGRVTEGADDAPVEGVRISAYVILPQIPEERLNFAPVDGRQFYGLSTDVHATQTDENGAYELAVGPGEYKLRHPGGRTRGEDIEITIPEENSPAEIEKNFHLDRPLKGPLTVRVVDQEGKPVPHATLQSRYQAYHGRSWYEPIGTNDKGVYETERTLERMVIQGASPDKTLEGIVHVDATATATTVVLGPTTSASGILLDESGDIAANKELGYAIKIPMGPNGSFTTAFGGSVITDNQGRFTMEGLVPGESYEVDMSLGEHSSRTVTTITAPTTKPHDLGEIKVDTKPYQPYVPPTPAERAADYFDASPDITVAEQLETMLGSARRMYTRPLVLVGRADDSVAIELFRRFYDESDGAEDEPSPSDLRWEFELIALDSTREDVAEYAKEHGVPIGEDDPPTLLALDEQGEIIDRLPLHLEREPVLAPKPGMNDQHNDGIAQRGENVLLSFLLEHKLPTRDAQTMLDEAFATAATEDKNVFLICSASWCGPCRSLAKFLDPHHEKLDEYYVFVHLDVSRDTHAQEINKKYKGERSGGVPWYVILDPEGNELISSNMPAEDDQAESEEEPEYKTNGPNMGNPGSPEGIDHFFNMLSTTAPDIDAGLLKTMREELEED